MNDKNVTNGDKYGYTLNEYSVFTKYGNYVLWGFFLIYSTIYSGRQNMSLTIPLLMESFEVSKSSMGYVTASFFVFYGIGQLVSGIIGKHTGNKKIILIGISLSVVVNFTVSFQTSFALLLVLWCFNGLSQAMVWAPGVSLINRWWPSDTRGYATGIISASTGFAQIVVYISVFISLNLFAIDEWRMAFRLPLIPILIAIVVFAVIAKNSPLDIGLKDYAEKDGTRFQEDRPKDKKMKMKEHLVPFKILLKKKKMRIFLIIISIASLARYGLLTWVPTYFIEVLKMDASSGILASILLPIGQTLAYFLMPFLSDKIFHGKREPILIICSTISVLGIMIFPFVTTAIFASTLLLILGFFSSVNGLIWAFAGDIGSREHASTATGLLEFAAAMGAVIQSVLFGYVSEYSWTAFFIIVSSMYAILVLLSFKAKKIEE